MLKCLINSAQCPKPGEKRLQHAVSAWKGIILSKSHYGWTLIPMHTQNHCPNPRTAQDSQKRVCWRKHFFNEIEYNQNAWKWNVNSQEGSTGQKLIRNGEKRTQERTHRIGNKGLCSNSRCIAKMITNTTSDQFLVVGGCSSHNNTSIRCQHLYFTGGETEAQRR